MLNKTRYLDVMTVSASRGSTLTKDDHKSLFVEPICLPNMSHLKVDKPTEAGEACLFYPSGHKSVQMKSEIDKAVRRITSEIAIAEQLESSRPQSKKATFRKNRGTQSWKVFDESSLNRMPGSIDSDFQFAADGTMGESGMQSTGKKKSKGSGQLYRSLPMDKQSKELFKKIRENESKIVATIIPRF